MTNLRSSNSGETLPFLMNFQELDQSPGILEGRYDQSLQMWLSAQESNEIIAGIPTSTHNTTHNHTHDTTFKTTHSNGQIDHDHDVETDFNTDTDWDHD